MHLLAFPDDVAIGGLESQADQLAADAASVAAEAEALALSLFRGDAQWRERRPVSGAVGARPTGPRRVA